MKHLIIIIVALLVIEACDNPNRRKSEIHDALELAGENRLELEKVIKHYAMKKKDSLKLRAAFFLIENMYNHHHDNYPELYEPIFDSLQYWHDSVKHVNNFQYAGVSDAIQRRNIRILRRKLFDKAINLAKSDISEFPKRNIKDIQVVTADMLIENIDWAFAAHQEINDLYSLSFVDFCEFVLPYRATNEPLDLSARKQLYDKYSWFYDTLRKNNSIEKSIAILHNTLNLSVHNNKYPGVLSVNQIEIAKTGSCDELVNYLVNLLRALGIPSSCDFVPHWGDHHNWGHSWLYIKLPKGFLALDPGGDDIQVNKEMYRISSLPKIYRRTYSFNHTLFGCCIDKTYEYQTASDATINNLFNTTTSEPVCAFVFNSTKEWFAVDVASSHHTGYVTFDNLSSNVIFLAGSLENGSFTPLNYPFMIMDSGKVTYFKPDKEHRFNEVRIDRKYPLTLRRGLIKEAIWTSSIEGTQILFYNESDSQVALSFNIENVDNGLPVKIKLSSSKAFQYFRFKSKCKKEIHLAEIKILDTLGKKIEVEVNDNLQDVESTKLLNLTDDDPLSFVSFENGLDIKFRITSVFQKPKFIIIQPRNDDNYIRPGDTYELFFWDIEWQSLGIKQAKDYMLYFEDVPKNSIYWLRNLTRGKEEHIFYLNEEGRQIWPSNEKVEQALAIHKLN